MNMPKDFVKKHYSSAPAPLFSLFLFSLIALGAYPVFALEVQKLAGVALKKENESTCNENADQLRGLVASPSQYLNKEVCIAGDFDSFSSTLALDYSPAQREGKDFLSLVIARPKTKIPLSELKLAVRIKDAQKHLALAKIQEGDRIFLKGIVFSAALGEAWVDVSELKVIPLPGRKKEEESLIDSMDEE